ncbi:hypothetical protein ACO0LD_05700 [Undibacterium sp. Ji83W]|uniref:hypothetical protein n=1 Tax=Undibacterium sp. Ji83W TaxID=3413043 RepID=UPI003BF08827
MRNFLGFHFLTKNQNLAALNDQQVVSDITTVESAKETKILTPAKQHMHLKKMEERSRHLRTMYFSS